MDRLRRSLTLLAQAVARGRGLAHKSQLSRAAQHGTEHENCYQRARSKVLPMCPVAELLIPDNLKSGINKSSFYDPEINRSYAKMAAHYNVGVVPARPRKPKDKAAVEAGVRFAQSYIVGRLRNVIFFSLAECQAAIVV